MAKTGLEKSFAKAYKSINAQARQLASGRQADFKYVSGLEDSIYSNLFGAINKGGRQLTKGSTRILGAMSSLLDTQRQLTGANLRDTASAIKGSYGGVFSDFAAKQSVVTEAKASEGNKNAGALADQGAAMAKTGQGLIKIVQAGAQEAQAGANYAVQQGLNQRAAADAATIASERTQVAMMKLQAQIQAQQAEAAAATQFKYAKKNILWQEQHAAQQGQGSPDELARTGAQMTGELNQYIQANPDATAQAAVQDLMAKGIITGDPTKDPVAAQQVNMASALFSKLSNLGPGKSTMDSQRDILLQYIQDNYDYNLKSGYGAGIWNYIKAYYLQQHAKEQRQIADPAADNSLPGGAPDRFGFTSGY